VFLYKSIKIDRLLYINSTNFNQTLSKDMQKASVIALLLGTVKLQEFLEDGTMPPADATWGGADGTMPPADGAWDGAAEGFPMPPSTPDAAWDGAAEGFPMPPSTPDAA
jgi:hypothetical protein